MDDLGSGGVKRHAPATLRNRDAIAEVLKAELPKRGTVLEVASGTGEHAVFFAAQFPHLRWQPSDPDTDALKSIAAYRAEYASDNVCAPVQLDASTDDWPVQAADAIVCINMVHISPWEATEGLFDGAARLLGEDAPLILYGPYIEPEIETAPSNVEFDASLKARDPRWGIRDVEDVDRLGQGVGLVRAARYAMPANNIALVYRHK